MKHFFVILSVCRLPPIEAFLFPSIPMDALLRSFCRHLVLPTVYHLSNLQHGRSMFESIPGQRKGCFPFSSEKNYYWYFITGRVPYIHPERAHADCRYIDYKIVIFISFSGDVKRRFSKVFQL